MSYESQEYIDRKVYEDGFPDRILESELSVNGIYTVLFAFKQRDHRYATRFNARVGNVSLDVHGDNAVHFFTLDMDLQPHHKTPFGANISQGKIGFDNYSGLLIEGEEVGEGYFKNYEDTVGFDLALWQALDVDTFASR